jgi:hypothetical protein
MNAVACPTRSRSRAAKTLVSVAKAALQEMLWSLAVVARMVIGATMLCAVSAFYERYTGIKEESSAFGPLFVCVLIVAISPRKAIRFCLAALKCATAFVLCMVVAKLLFRAVSE